jgi:hypothetical protein
LGKKIIKKRIKDIDDQRIGDIKKVLERAERHRKYCCSRSVSWPLLMVASPSSTSTESLASATPSTRMGPSPSAAAAIAILPLAASVVTAQILVAVVVARVVVRVVIVVVAWVVVLARAIPVWSGSGIDAAETSPFAGIPTAVRLMPVVILGVSASFFFLDNFRRRVPVASLPSIVAGGGAISLTAAPHAFLGVAVSFKSLSGRVNFVT